MAEFIDKAKEKVHDMTDRLAEHAKSAEKKAEDVKDKVKNALGDVKHDVTESARRLKEDLKK